MVYNVMKVGDSGKLIYYLNFKKMKTNFYLNYEDGGDGIYSPPGTVISI